MANEANEKAPIHLTFMRSRLFVYASALATLLTFAAFALTFDPVKRLVYGRDVSLRWTVLSEVPVFDIRRPLPELRVIYQGQDVTRSNRSIVVSTVQVLNDGNEPIGPSRLTDADPLGFHVDGGSILRILATSGSTDHLRTRVRPSQSADSVFLGRGWIMDPKDSVRISVLIQKPATTQLTYRTLGKVGGIRSSSFSTKTAESSEGGFLSNVFGGSPLVQIVRLVTYFLIAVGLIIFAVWLVTTTIDARDRRRRTQRMDLIDTVLSTRLDERDEVVSIIRQIYLGLGMPGLIRLRSILSRPSNLEDDYVGLLKSKYAGRFKKKANEKPSTYLNRVLRPFSPLSDFVLAIEALNLFDWQDGTTSVDFEELLNHAIEGLTSSRLSRQVYRADPKNGDAVLSLRAPTMRRSEIFGPMTENVVFEFGY